MMQMLITFSLFIVTFILPVNSSITNGLDSKQLFRRHLSEVEGSLNVWILIDVSSDISAPARLAMAKETAHELLNTISSSSYFNIGIYSTSARFLGKVLIPASSDNIVLGHAFVDKITVDSATFASVGEAVMDLLHEITTSDYVGETSDCHNSVVYLGSSGNEMSHKNIDDLLNDYKGGLGQLIIFSMQIVDVGVAPLVIDPIYRDMACYQRGLYFQLNYTKDNWGNSTVLSPRVQNDIERFVKNYLVYFEKVSTEYGLRRRALELTDNTEDCPSLDLSKATLEDVRSTSNDNCVDPITRSYFGSGTLYLDENEMEFDALTAFIWLFGFGISVLLILFAPVKNKDAKSAAIVYLFIVWMSLGIYLCWYIMVDNWTNIVQVNDFKQATARSLETDISQFQCCSVTGCSCTQAESSIETCAYNEILGVEGPCDYGYHCCKKECYECNCRDVRRCSDKCDSEGNCRRSCSTQRECSICCECVQEVENRLCSTECGICYDGAVAYEYTPYGETTPVVLEITKECGYGVGRECAENFITGYEIDTTFPVYYNPTNYLEVELSVGYPHDFWDRVITMGVFCGLNLIIAAVIVAGVLMGGSAYFVALTLSAGAILLRKYFENCGKAVSNWFDTFVTAVQASYNAACCIRQEGAEHGIYTHTDTGAEDLEITIADEVTNDEQVQCAKAPVDE